MAEVSKPGTTISLTTLEKIAKLQDQEGFLRWKRTMRDHLKIFGLWVYIVEKHERLVEGDAGLDEWIKSHDLTCTALRICVEGNAYSDIENISNAKTAWTTLETNFQPRGSGYLNDTFRKLDNLTLSSCKGSSDYVSKFRMIVNEIQSFSTKMKLDENWLIYQFHTNLGSEHSGYFERYSQEHDPFDENGNTKHTLSSAMQHFQNTIRNPSSHEKSVISMAAIMPNAAFVSPNQPANQTMVQPGAQAGTSKARVITLQKTVKYCTYCKRDYHTEDECHDKYPHLKEAKIAAAKPGTKRRRNGKPVKDEQADNNPGEGSYFIQPELGSFMAIPANPLLSKLWIWDTGTSRHSTCDRKLFLNFRPLVNPFPIQGLGGAITPQGIGDIRLECKDQTGATTSLLLRDAHFMPNSGVNLISQGQLQKEGYALKIVSAGIEIGPNRVLAKLIENNLYVLDTISFQLSLSSFAGINPETLKLWHSRLGHLGKQNILRLTTMSEGIDLSKPPPTDACPPCSKAKMHVEPHQDKIEPGQFLLDLIHSDVSGPYLPSCSRAKYYVTFLDDYDKTSEVVLISSKDRELSPFDFFQKRDQFGEACIRCLCIVGGGEYDSHAFEDYRDENCIIWEANVPGNPQMNGAAECLGQTLYGMASAILKESNLPMKYWSELILTSNYSCN